MSFKKVIGNFFRGFAKIWKSIVPTIKEKAEEANELLDKIKDGATFDKLTEGMDPEMVDKIKHFLDVVMVKAGMVKGYVDGMDADSILNSIRAGIDEATANGDIYRNTFLNSTSILLTDVYVDGKLGWDDLLFVPKFIFSFIRKK